MLRTRGRRGGGEGVELVDLHAGRAVGVDALAGGRRSFSTLGVSDGLVVLVGGYDESIRLTGTFATVPVADLSESVSGRSSSGPRRSSGRRAGGSPSATPT